MNGENNGTRNFPTPDPNRPKKEVDFRKIVSIAILATAIAVVLLFCAAIIAQIVCKVSSGKAPEDTPPVSEKSDIEFKSDVLSKSEITSGELQLATKEHPAYLSDGEIENLVKLLTSPSRKDDSTEYYTIAGTPQSDRLTLETSESFGALTKALYKELKFNDITIKYAYFVPKNEGTESYDYPHALGTTVDLCLLINGDSYPLSQKPEVLEWINKNCARFGFINSDPSGEVHDKGATVPTTQLRYVGIPHATYIMQNEISFEDYINLIKSYYTPNNRLIITGTDNIDYAVYYVAVDGVSAVKVPSNYDFEKSGNNDGGVIITVKMK